MRAQGIEAKRETLWANFGGPMVRSREAPLKGSLLGKEKGSVRCPLVLQVGLDFEGVTGKVSFLLGLLKHVGLEQPQELVGRFEFPVTRLIARPTDAPPTYLSALHAPAEAVLEQALWLGLCTAFLYDPYRPVLWTDASLGRKLDLYRPEGFYA